MSRVIITEGASKGLERCRFFLAEKNPQASQRAAKAIEASLIALSNEPEMGRPLEDIPEFRELIIPFGDSGYVALYRFNKKTDTIHVLAFRHQKEVGY